MCYFLTAYLMCLANIYLAGKEKALLYIIAFIVFAVIAFTSLFLNKSKAFHYVLITFYTIAVGFLVVQHGIYVSQFNDYLLMAFEFAVFFAFSTIELLTPSATSEGVK